LPALLALRYARPRRVPLLLWWGGTRASEEGVSLLKRCWRRFLFGRVSGFLAYSELAAAFLRDHAGVGAKPIRVLGNNTMDGQAWADAVDALRPRPHPALVTLLGVGRLVPSKNYDLVLHALARLPAERRSCCRLVLVGDGPASAGLRALAAQLRLASQVELAGAVPQAEVAKFMAQAEVFVHPTTYDRWPQVINEAMAAGLAVVVSDRAGVPDDYLRPGENGGVCRPGDEAAWTEQLGRLIAEAPLRQRLGAAARTTALSRDVRFAQAQFVRAVQENLVI
jgi:glycosyltransferase involved in cell wall biosynthesis